MRTARRLLPPIGLLAVVGILFAMAQLGIAPSPTDLVARLSHALGEGSALFIFAAALIEGTVGVNAYFPGAFVILMAMASAHGLLARALRIFVSIVGGAAVAQHLDFAIGRRFAGSSEQPRTRRWRLLRGALTYWHPQLGSAYSLQLGSERTSYREFLLILAGTWLPWNLFWGVLMYTLGSVPLRPGGFVGIFVAYLILWTAVEAYALVRARKAAEQRRIS